MPEYGYQQVEAWNTALRLATAIGRLKVGSNLKAAADAQQHAFEQAGLACALIADGSTRDGGAQAALYRDARGALVQSRSWLHVLAAVMNEPDTVFGNELDLAEAASRQLSALLRTMERGPGPGASVGGPRQGPPAGRGGPPQGGRPPGRGSGAPR
jgi:hypothetical protein